MKKVLKLLGVLSLLLFTVACSDDNNSNYELEEIGGKNVYTIEETKYIDSENETDLVLIDIKNKGIMIAELYPKTAPITVENFKKLVKEKFYSNLTFHRVINNFMIQTGDPTATGTGGSDENIKGEFSINGVENNLSHTRGVLSMARRGSDPETEETMNSASSQFFIVHADSTYLDGKYAAFGKVIHGIDIVDQIASVQTDAYDKPIKDVIINEIKFVENYQGE